MNLSLAHAQPFQSGRHVSRSRTLSLYVAPFLPARLSRARLTVMQVLSPAKHAKLAKAPPFPSCFTFYLGVFAPLRENILIRLAA